MATVNKWEETVLSPEELLAIRADIPGTRNIIEFAREVSNRTAKKQARISYEAGVLKGRKEVVDFANKFQEIRQIPEWQKQLKEWGIK